MNWLQTFSESYANGITSIAAIGVFFLTGATLWYLKREYSSKCRPYIFPGVHAEPFPDKLGCVVSIIPKNVGSHPCKIKICNIYLTIGDETHTTPETKDCILVGPHGIGIQIPAGHINENGVTRIREGRYKSNRVEVGFVVETTSVENKFTEKKSYVYEIYVQGGTPQVLFRPEWIKNT